MNNKNTVNSNCKSCPAYLNKRCIGDDAGCICKFCPRHLKTCIIVKWCRETESEIYFED